MPSYNENVYLLGKLKDQHKGLLSDFQSQDQYSSGSVTDFMKFLGSKGIEGMDPSAANRDRLLGLGAPTQQMEADLPDIADDASLEELTISAAPDVNWDAGELAPQIDMSALPQPKKFDVGMKDLTDLTIGGSAEAVELPGMPEMSNELNFGQKLIASGFKGTHNYAKSVSDIDPIKIPSLDNNKLMANYAESKSKMSLPSKDDLMGNLSESMTKMPKLDISSTPELKEQLAGLAGKTKDVAGKAMGGFDKYAGGAMMAFQGKAAADAADKAINKLQEGMRQMGGMRGDAVRDREAEIDSTEAVTKAAIRTAAASGTESLKQIQEKTKTNIATGAVKKKVSDVRSNLQNTMKQTISLARTRQDKSMDAISAKSRGRFEDIDSAESSIKDALEQAEKAKKMAVADTVVGAVSLGVDVFTGGQGGKAIRTGYGAGKAVYNSYG